MNEPPYTPPNPPVPPTSSQQSRPPCERTAESADTNVVRYRWRAGHAHPPAAPPDAPAASEVLFIDESTPTPPLPERQPDVPISRRRNDGDVFYIGPE